MSLIVTCDQALFSFSSVKHSGGKGETTVREYESDAKIGLIAG